MRLFTDGAESGDLLFWNIATGTVSASTAQARSGTYSYLANGSSVYQKNISPVTEIYIRVGIFTTNNNGSTTNIQWRNGSTILGGIRVTGGVLVLFVSGTQVATGTITIQNNTWYLIEAHVKIADSGGIIDVKVDGAQDATFTGDTKPSTQTTIDNLYYIPQIGVTFHFDDLAANDTTGSVDNSWCGDGHIVRLAPNAAGDVTGLQANTGANYTCVDEVPSNGDTDFVFTTTGGFYDLYNIGSLADPNVSILRVQPYISARNIVAGSGHVQLMIKTNGTEYLGGVTDLITTYANYSGVSYLKNPFTNANWTLGEIDNLQIGTKIVN